MRVGTGQHLTCKAPPDFKGLCLLSVGGGSSLEGGNAT